ncbi:MAG: hypothetical protein KBB65_09455 [Syntrophorhabdaceae bacterium]|nr:hypothetical protein [Syntrophorhabdaceae bacterium]
MKRFVSTLLVMTLIVGFGAIAAAGLVYDRAEAADSEEATASVEAQAFPSEGPALVFEWIDFVGPDIDSN